MNQPTAVTVRAYQVGFGDCFLLTFHYPKRDRHILIDFGSTGAPKGFGDMNEIAEQIKEHCGGKLDAVVATHRHKDHISGFATNGQGSGSIIKDCNPEVVIQPWTEHPDAAEDAVAAPGLEISKDSHAFARALLNMHSVAQSVLDEAPRLLADAALEEEDDEEEAEPEGEHEGEAPKKRPKPLLKRLTFMGDNNLPNRSAIENLMSMGKKRVYVHAGSKCGLERLLPGVKVRVLGPPTLEQTATIRKQRSTDRDEFWHFQAAASRRAASPAAQKLFPDAPVLEGKDRPKWSRWLLPRLKGIRGEQLRELVRILDQAMNNTSVILLFEVGKHKLLFPGDAQLENWQFALSQKSVQKLLKDVTFYKVGHHGSLNATPKSLWNLFGHRNKKEVSGRLRTLVSTMKGKHGDSRRSTEVPRSTLVQALEAESHFVTTQSIKVKDGLFVEERIEV